MYVAKGPRVSESVRNLAGIAPEPPTSRSVFLSPRNRVWGVIAMKTLLSHIGFGARTWIWDARIRWGRDNGEERRGLREGWRHMGCCKERMFREKDVEL